MSHERKIVLAILVIAALLTVGGLAGAALAQGGDAMPHPSERRGATVAGQAAAKQWLLLMDKNKDGKVSKEEWMSFMAAEFDRLDTNHDGFVDVKDLEQSQIKPVPFYRAGK
jgi:hypothetical protein